MLPGLKLEQKHWCEKIGAPPFLTCWVILSELCCFGVCETPSYLAVLYITNLSSGTWRQPSITAQPSIFVYFTCWGLGLFLKHNPKAIKCFFAYIVLRSLNWIKINLLDALCCSLMFICITIQYEIFPDRNSIKIDISTINCIIFLCQIFPYHVIQKKKDMLDFIKIIKKI
jgi:hypothetical protein